MSVFQQAIKNFLAPIGDLLDDSSVSEVMINGHQEIFVEKSGIITRVPHEFSSEDALLSAIRSIAQSVGRSIDDDNPRLDARLPDGSRIHAVLPPMARKGTTVAIRKFSSSSPTLKNLIEWGTLSKAGARFLDICVHLGKNLLVSGGTGSGKTTVLNILGGRIPEHQRLLIVEDAAELQIQKDHVVSFESRKADEVRGTKEVSIRDLIISAMRLRPDRVIIGEVRAGEALDLLQVMNTGHDGSMGTVHANTPEGACRRLETLCLMGGTQIPSHGIQKMVSSALQVVVQCTRLYDGSRKISYISEILGVDEEGRYLCKDLFRWFQRGKDQKTGNPIGEMAPCGTLPTFFQEIVVNKIPFPKDQFVAPDWVGEILSSQRPSEH